MKKFLILGLLWCNVLSAATFESGVKAYDKFEYQKAYKIWLPLAEQGNNKAQYNLGVIFDQGDGRDADLKKAFDWYLKSANSGYSEAQYRVGNAYYFGKGVKQDYDQAISFWKKSAEQGQSSAQYNLGVLYFYGGSKYKNIGEAKKWLQQAADQKHVAASQLLTSIDKKVKVTKPVVAQKQATKSSKENLPLVPKITKKVDVPPPVVKGESLVLKGEKQSDKKTKKAKGDWISQQPKQNYTVQLTVRNNVAQANRFIKKHHLQSKAYAYKLKGSSTVKVIYGSYAKRSGASQAIRGLSKVLRKDSPWAKKFVLVRAERGY